MTPELAWTYARLYCMVRDNQRQTRELRAMGFTMKYGHPSPALALSQPAQRQAAVDLIDQWNELHTSSLREATIERLRAQGHDLP